MKLPLFVEIVIPLLMGGIAAYIAKNRGRNPVVWFFVGVIFGLLGIIVLFLLPKVEPIPSNFFGVRHGKDPHTIEVAVTEVPNPIFELRQKEWYWLDADHKQLGPISFVELQDLWKKGTVTAKSYVWSAGMEQWRQIEEIEEMLKALVVLPLNP